ncbi:Ger(x)C family spore germination protein [Cytobacillus sp. FJAT-54145]|uniref:Ger(X)C family spore germination protein n=1 Tax=Cytobacillus spartinae TaxID=3299023 RepID=A0ABW6KDQ2_9BACI
MNRIYPLLMIITLCLTGCWDRIEMNDVSIVTGLAVDRGEDQKYMLTVEAVNPTQFSKQKGGDDAPVTTFSLEGDTISELTDKMNVGMTRKLIFSHTRVLFISEEIAKEGVVGFLDFLERSGEFRNDFNILITKGMKAADFTRITYPLQKVPSLKIHKQIESFGDEWGGDPRVRLTDFISSMTSKGRSPVASAISVKGDAEKGEKVENNKSLSVDALVTMEGIALFEGDRLKGYLSLKDTRNFVWTQDLDQTSLSVPCKESTKDEPKYFNVRVNTSSTKLHARYQNNQPILSVKIDGETSLAGSHCANDLTKLDSFKEMEKLINAHVKNEIEGTLNKVQKDFGLDIFGFGEVMNRQHYKKYKEVEGKWNEEFSRANFEVDVKYHLIRSGIKSKSFLVSEPAVE